jgi:hypothetical protein
MTNAHRVKSAGAFIAVLSVLIASSSGFSSPKGIPLEVDLQLVLAVDVSSSMAEAEQLLQREGYAHGRSLLD